MKNKYKYVEDIGVIFKAVGVILLFISIWLNGWIVLRCFLTSVLLIGWGTGLCKEYEKLKKYKKGDKIKIVKGKECGKEKRNEVNENE